MFKNKNLIKIIGVILTCALISTFTIKVDARIASQIIKGDEVPPSSSKGKSGKSSSGNNSSGNKSGGSSSGSSSSGNSSSGSSSSSGGGSTYVDPNDVQIPIEITTDGTKSKRTQSIIDFYNKCTDDIATTYMLGYQYLESAQRGYVKLTAKTGEFRITAVEEGHFDEEENYVFDSYYPTSLVNPDSVINKVIKSQSVSLNNGVVVQVLADAAHEGKVVRFEVVINRSDSNCMSWDAYNSTTSAYKKTLKQYIYLEIIDLAKIVPAVRPNPQYNTLCTVIRDGNNYNNKYTSILKKWYNTSEAKNFYLELLDYCYNDQVVYEYKDEQLDSAINSVINSYYITYQNELAKENPKSEEFSKAFDASYVRAYNQGHLYPANLSQQDIQNGLNMKCDYKKMKNTSESIVEDGYQYDSNTYSYYGTETNTETVTYNYNYGGRSDNKRTESANACTRTCEEAVDVNYGYPQAAIAGLCFEYQVKVVSRVKCSSNIIIAPPTKSTVCQPIPSCVHRDGNTITQGGPNEDFDECILECDGGKYSQSCSKKCYNKVYGKSSKTKGTSSIFTYNVKPISATMNDITGGYYTRDTSTNKIKWVMEHGKHTYAKWYVDQDAAKLLREDYRNNGRFTSISGFKKLGKGNNDACGADCSHVGCGDQSYLTDEEATRDYAANLAAYNAKVSACQAQATCSTNVAEFSMNTTYKQNGETKDVYFPGPKNNDTTKLNSLQSGTIESKQVGVVKEFGGCYETADAHDTYKAVITFPGTWVNNKSGEISYIDKSGVTGWHLQKNKYCVPLTADKVNEKWWNWYMVESTGNTSATNGSYKSQKYADTCKNYTNKEENTVKESDIEYNIKATAKKFGYFGWNFNLSCFYAVGETNEDPKCNLAQDNYTMRTVTNEDLFPSDKEGGLGTDTSVNKSNTGRDAGFNWTSAATIPIYKSKDYAVNPEVLIHNIQKRGNDIYNEENESQYLDYEFDLTPATLNKIKDYNRKNDNNYLEWTGTFEEDNPVRPYVSGLFRNGGILSSNKITKKVGNIGCNNDASDNRCENLIKMSSQ